jgi:hypothetical protein
VVRPNGIDDGQLAASAFASTATAADSQIAVTAVAEVFNDT